MKKELLFLAISLCVSLTLNAQDSIAFSTSTVTEVNVGTELSVTLEYTKETAGKISLQVQVRDSDNNYISDAISYIGIYEEKNVSIATTTTNETIAVDIPTSTTDTSSLLGDNKHVVIIQLINVNSDGTNSVLKSQMRDITLMGTTTVAPTINPIVPADLVVGTDLTITGTYTHALPEAGIILVGLAIYTGDNWNEDVIYNNGGNGLSVDAGVNVPIDIVVSIPIGTTISSNLTDKNYKVIVRLYDGDWGSLAGDLYPITLTSAATAGLKDINVDDLVMYPNPVPDILKIKNVGVSEIRSFQIVDILGQVVIKQNNNKKVNSIDVSELPKGLYFLISNNRQFKFVKE